MRSKTSRLWIFFPLGLVLVALTAWWLGRSDDLQPSARLQAPAYDLSGFARADGPVEIRFPEDNGPHPDFLTEWWYYTGNLSAEDGRHFGFELTFFRRALAPPAALPADRISNWAADQLYMAHFSFADIEADQFYAFERFSRGAAGLSGAVAQPYEVWLEDWTVTRLADGTYRLYAAQDELRIELNLTDTKGPILHGIDGYSRKGQEPGNASYYISQTRLAAEGAVQLEDRMYRVEGQAWMDHEYSTIALSPDQVGWDWFSIQLDDGTELMLFQVRQEDGEIAEFSSATFIAADASTTALSNADFTITVLDEWESPNSGAVYPSAWTIDIPSLDLELDIQPYMEDQELRVSFTYWEGAVQVSGSRSGSEVNGSGYVELTGYAHSMQGEF